MITAPLPIQWGARDARERGPIVAGLDAGSSRNAIGVHAGAYGLYAALAVATGDLNPHHRPDLTNTQPSVSIGPFAAWSDPTKIVTFDPWGHLVGEIFAEERRQGLDIRPSIAITDGHLRMGEIDEAMRRGRLCPDGRVLTGSGDIRVTKIAIEPVWWLPGIADRLRLKEDDLRQTLFRCTDGMYPALIDDPARKVFLPPIGGTSVYLFGDAARIGDPSIKITCRVHDECSGSDVFGSDICTCRPYLAFGVEEAVRTAQSGGLGVVVYNRKEGRALGEVIKLLVYNARSRSAGGDRADAYFDRTHKVAGVCDMRFQALSTDVLHWLGLKRIDRWISMSNLKADAVRQAGIRIVRQISIPDDRVPPHANVEITAKRAAGYFEDGAASNLVMQIARRGAVSSNTPAGNR
jgi:GTP cyclohydrolase II